MEGYGMANKPRVHRASRLHVTIWLALALDYVTVDETGRLPAWAVAAKQELESLGIEFQDGGGYHAEEESGRGSIGGVIGKGVKFPIEEAA